MKPGTRRESRSVGPADSIFPIGYAASAYGKPCTAEFWKRRAFRTAKTRKKMLNCSPAMETQTGKGTNYFNFGRALLLRGQEGKRLFMISHKRRGGSRLRGRAVKPYYKTKG